MNDSMSILLATSLLALGGLGLYMYKSSDKEEDESIKDDSSFFGGMWEHDEGLDDADGNEEDVAKPPRKRVSIKTQRNRKSMGTSKRRYY